MNYKQVYAMKDKREQRIKAVCPAINDDSGIYVFYRIDENGIKHAYCGQAKHLLQRTAAHLGEYDRIALSLKKRGFGSKENPHGWFLIFKNCPESLLDTNERITIKVYADKGFQLYNSTAGGQGEGKSGLDKNKPSRGYHDGIAQGYLNAQRFVAHLFDKHLDYKPKSDKPNKHQEKAMQKFKEFMEF